MSQFSAGITAMQSESKFAKAYNEGVAKTKYWEVRNERVMKECRYANRGRRGLFSRC